MKWPTSAFGTFRTSRDVRHESAFRGKAENIYSERVFRLLTQLRHWSRTTAIGLVSGDKNVAVALIQATGGRKFVSITHDSAHSLLARVFAQVGPISDIAERNSCTAGKDYAA